MAPSTETPDAPSLSPALVRRRALLAGLLAGPVLVAGAELAAAEPPLLTEAPTSPNGWPVAGSAAAIGVRGLVVPGTSVSLPVSATPAGALLVKVALAFHQQVEALGTGCWGWAYRANVNSPGVWSNHASGTAVDLNAPLHPNGRAQTFSAPQQAAIRRILAACDDTVRWGGDYSRTKDEMHFEVVVRPGDPRLGRALADFEQRLAAPPATTPDPNPGDDLVRNLIIAKQSRSDEVWVGDGMARRRVADLEELRGLQYWVRIKGGDPTVHTIDDLRILGVPV